MKRFILVLSVTILASFAASAQTTQKYIGMTKAKQIASAKVAGAIKSAEREKEHGKMIYSFDIKSTDGKTHEVNIDAVTGDVIASTVETAADEAKEKAADKKARKH
ncbi:MAG: PepSY domain-containing protein [Acidobacteriota bacterium]